MLRLTWSPGSRSAAPDRVKSFGAALLAADLAAMPKGDAFPSNTHLALAMGYACRASSRPTAFGNECFLDELAAAEGRSSLAPRQVTTCQSRAGRTPA